ncbi:hypothetical protein GCM10010517_38130 [Streptosporangium fragile]|uniref:Uncharacterized protein n=1 Tax=Streptosporangium fragile TaxID=46186 RepID=A0ABN3VZE3_9ACTN
MSVKDELREVEEDIERLRSEVAELRRQVGDLGPSDAAERSMLINQADEEQALLLGLEARREDLIKRLNE